jgi:hypothetical protein
LTISKVEGLNLPSPIISKFDACVEGPGSPT